jgi:hypothetical protein
VVPEVFCSIVAGGNTCEGGEGYELSNDKGTFVVLELECKISVFGNFQASDGEESEKACRIESGQI